MKAFLDHVEEKIDGQEKTKEQETQTVRTKDQRAARTQVLLNE